MTPSMSILGNRCHNSRLHSRNEFQHMLSSRDRLLQLLFIADIFSSVPPGNYEHFVTAVDVCFRSSSDLSCNTSLFDSLACAGGLKLIGPVYRSLKAFGQHLNDNVWGGRKSAVKFNEVC